MDDSFQVVDSMYINKCKNVEVHATGDEWMVGRVSEYFEGAVRVQNMNLMAMVTSD